MVVSVQLSRQAAGQHSGHNTLKLETLVSAWGDFRSAAGGPLSVMAARQGL